MKLHSIEKVANGYKQRRITISCELTDDFDALMNYAKHKVPGGQQVVFNELLGKIIQSAKRRYPHAFEASKKAA